MGNDGGSIPTRRELVKEAAREKTTSEVWDASQQNAAYHWTYCPLSKKPLSLPVVSDSAGRLLNKDSVLEWFLEPEAFGDGAEVLKLGGVAGLKDVVDVKFEVDGKAWVCPVSRKELGPGSRAVYLVPCGHAFAQAVISEIKEDRCLVCSEAFLARDVIPINPSLKSDVDRLKARAEKLASEGLSHSLKKVSSKKRKKEKEKKHSPRGEEANGSAPAAGSADACSAAATAPRAAETSKASSSSIANAATASITSRVLAEQESSKRRKVESDNVRSLFTSSAAVSKDANGVKPSANRDFMSRGYTIPANKAGQ